MSYRNNKCSINAMRCFVLFCCDEIVMTTERMDWMNDIHRHQLYIELRFSTRTFRRGAGSGRWIHKQRNLSVAIAIEVKEMAGTINKSCNPSSDRSVKPIHSLLFPHSFVRLLVRSFVHRNSISIMHECVMCARAYVWLYVCARALTHSCRFTTCTFFGCF